MPMSPDQSALVYIHSSGLMFMEQDLRNTKKKNTLEMNVNIFAEMFWGSRHYLYFPELTFPHGFIPPSIHPYKKSLVLLELVLIVGITSKPLAPSPFSSWSTKTLKSQRQKWAVTQYDRWRKAVSHPLMYLCSGIIVKPGTYCTI